MHTPERHYPVPPERPFPAQGISVSLGDADGLDPALLAGISGAECLSGDGLGSQFAQRAAADALPPGPALAALTEAAVKDVTRLSDDQLVGVLQAARRQENREAWKKALVIAEFARRREAEFKQAEARGVPVHCRQGQFPGEELAIELLLGPVQASHAIDDATGLTTRLPQTLAGMAAGLIDEARAGIIALYTRSLTPADAALADCILAALAPTVRIDQLRLLAFADLTAGRNPLDRLGPADAAGTQHPDTPAPSADADDVCGLDSGQGDSAGSLDYRHDHDVGCPAPDPRPPAPVPALINLVVHAGALFGWDTTPTEAGGWGLLDADETRGVVAAASRHPATRWCTTVIGPDGTALAHGCSPGRHPWTIPRQAEQAEHGDQPGRRAPDPDQADRLAAFLRGLNVTLQPIARDGCAHAAAEPRYTPSRKLTHLVRARTATCDAPGCGAQAQHCDLDHTIAYPDGLTDQCNLGPRCRRHHKAKQAPGWKVEQPEPGVIRWTLPSGRTRTTRPTVYDPRLP